MWVAVNHLQDGGTKTGLMRSRAAATIVAILWFSAAFTAQEAPTRDATAPAFDVVSIRALASSARGRTPGAQQSHGRFARGSATVRQLIQERPVYRMVMARRDGRLGPSIYSVEDAGCGGSAPQPCDLVAWSGGLTSLGMELQQLAAALFNRSQTTGIDRPVVDHTGQDGMFGFTLTFSSFADEPSLSDDPSIFTALREQLGLKLEPARGCVEVLVIDSVAQPTPN